MVSKNEFLSGGGHEANLCPQFNPCVVFGSNLTRYDFGRFLWGEESFLLGLSCVVVVVVIWFEVEWLFCVGLF